MAVEAEIRGVLSGFGLVAAGVLVLARVDLGLPRPLGSNHLGLFARLGIVAE
ncbi:hypothetical protein [Pelagibacterium sp.]|uniref:hypothetical protein n=1 Tax=Pelagibacterium sp. TaxID=1967288 RepID=UPI003BAB7F0F